MFFSVVTVTKDRPELFKQVLSDLENQAFSHDEFEHVIVDGSSDENYAKMQEIVNATTINARLIQRPRNCKLVTARNIGIKESRGDWLVLISDDVRIPPDYLQIAEERINANPDICGIEGAITTNNTSPLVHSASNQKGSLSRKYVGYLSANMVLRRQLLVDLGGFDESLPLAHPF